MAAAIQAIRGMKDLLPEEMGYWHKLEKEVAQLMSLYAYQEIRMPLLERTELFKRGIGEVTDIVEKEMYTFLDRNNESLTLRPESTAQCVRAGLEHGLLYNQTPRLWYYGPMFRYERPQKGRYRQFYQFGAETFGIATPDMDAEHILMMDRLWKALGIKENITLNINSLGTAACRKRYREDLVAYFTKHQAELDEDSQRRLKTNPLRILDTKNPEMSMLVHHAPKLIDYLSPEAKAHFDGFKKHLEQAGVSFVVNPTLVRGLDYYGLTVYEWVTDSLGAQGTVCGGGRYDDLVPLMGGTPTPAVGFAMGIERVVTLMQLVPQDLPRKVDAYLVCMGEMAESQSIYLAEKIRTQCPHLKLLTHCGGGGVKSQFKKADKSGAKVALVIGDDELAKGLVTIKFLREEKAQETILIESLSQISGYL